MPIQIDTKIRVFTQAEFHAVDREIMRVVFKVHNEFGRLLDEELYKREIAARCAESGIEPVEREVRIRVTHEDFAKDYVMDLLFEHGVMLEAKTVELLTSTHKSQALNYLLLAGMKHGRLVNLRTGSVQYEFVSTRLTPELRRQFKVVDADWRPINEQSRRLRGKMSDLLEDWGAFLDGVLYREALVHFLGGQGSVSQEVEILSGSRSIGTQRLNLLDNETAFAFTTLRPVTAHMRDHLQRLLQHTRIEHVQWINLYQHQGRIYDSIEDKIMNGKIMGPRMFFQTT